MKDLTLNIGNIIWIIGIIFTMGIALDTDCRPMNDLSEKKFEKISILREVLEDMLNQAK